MIPEAIHFTTFFNFAFNVLEFSIYSNQVLKILNGAHSLLKSISSDKNRHVSRMLVFKDKCLQITPTKKN